MTKHQMINFQINDSENYMGLQKKEIWLSETRKNTMSKMLFYLSFEKGKKLYIRRKEGRNSTC